MNSSIISQTKELFQKSRLQDLRAVYIAHSNNWDAHLKRLENEKRMEQAGELDRRFLELMPIKRERAWFAAADSLIAEILATSPNILQYCKTATKEAAGDLSEQISSEKEYLDIEEKIDHLAASKTPTSSWCSDVFMASLTWMSFDNFNRCRNAGLFADLRTEAKRIQLEMDCAPYLDALKPDSDFRTVLYLNSRQTQYDESEKPFQAIPTLDTLNQGIPSFDARWKERVAKATEEALKEADEYYNQGKTLYNAKQYDDALVLFIDADTFGNKSAAYYIGCHYYHGYGIKQNIDVAISFFQKAADNEIPSAMSDLADIYADRKDYSTAFTWRKRAVEHDMFQSGFDHFKLAMMYYHGTGTKQNYSEARRLLTELTQNGTFDLEEANAYLGKIYQEALGVEQDEKLALAYYEKAKNVKWAKKAYNALHQKLETERQEQEVIKYLNLAKAGDAYAQYFIGWCYYNGHCAQKSYEMARIWLEKAADQGNGKAMSLLGDIYANGYGIAADIDKAILYYEGALSHGEA